MGKARTATRFPAWLKARIPTGQTAAKVREILSGLRVNTVCGSALCPNIGECFHSGTAAFLIMGPNCTRACTFCAVGKGELAPLDADEPARVAEAARLLGLSHVVITSVTRDDIEDGGAGHFAKTIRAVRGACPEATVEVLVPDLRGARESVEAIVDARPDVFNHNVETVARLYASVRPQADYGRSLEVLRAATQVRKALGKGAEADRVGQAPPYKEVVTKSGMMVGLGEKSGEVVEVFKDLREAGVSIVTVGQYLRPSKEHIAVERFVTPEEFAQLERAALELGFEAAFAGPLVRSSYRAGEVFHNRRSLHSGSHMGQ